MSNNDKKLLFGQMTISDGADTNWAYQTATLMDNSSGQVNAVLDKVMCDVSLLPTAISKYYYCFLFVTDPGGSLPTGLSGINDAQLQTWITQYRKQIWMTAGGYAKFNAAVPDDERRIDTFEANTKRTLVPGQKLLLVVAGKNASASADTLLAVYDVNIFYHY
jgi:hypothetical protein